MVLCKPQNKLLMIFLFKTGLCREGDTRSYGAEHAKARILSNGESDS